MPWGWFKWPEYLKKKACRYLLQHYLGNYLETKISLEDLTINLYNGTATVSNVPLSAEALNESLQNVNAPIRIVSGRIGEVNVTIPWKALIRDNCTVQISGLKLVITPQVFSNYTTGAMMTESLLFSTMSTSLQVAEELLKTKSEEEETEAAGYEGMEAFARAIEIVLARVKVSLTDTIIQVNYENTDSSKLFLRLKIERIDFFDERSRVPSDEEAEVTVADIAIKILELSKPLLEFGHESCEQDHIDPSPLDTLTGLQQQIRSDESMGSQVDETSGVLVGMASGQMEVKVKVKQAETVPGPKLEIDGFLAAIHFLFTHEDLLLLMEMINGVIKSSGNTQHVIPLHKYQHNIPGISRPMQMKDRDQVERQLQRHVEQSRLSDHQRRDPWDLQSSGADSGDDFHSLEINACSELTSSKMFTDPNTTSVYSDTSASIYKSTFTLPPESPLSPDFPMQKPFAFKDPTKKITIPSSGGSFTTSDRGSPVFQKSFGSQHDISIYKFTISCFTFALLHKKPYYKSVEVETSVDPEEYLSLNDKGELCPLTYFDSVSQAVLTGRVLKGSDPNDKVSQVLPLDHLLLSAQTVNTTVNITGPSTKLHLSVGGTNIREYVYQNHLSRITKPVAIHSILTLTEDVHNIKPAIELNYSYTDDPEYKRKVHRFGKQFNRDGKVPEAKLGVEFHSVHVELDPTLLDRLDIIKKIPSLSRQSSSPDSFDKDSRSLYLPMSNANLHKQDYFDAALGSPDSVKHQTTIMLSCNALDIMLKFPTPDLREGVAVKMYSQPKLRQEVCYADISSLLFKTCLSDSKLTKYEVELKTLRAYLSASGRKEDRTLFLLVEADRHDSNRVYSDLPRIIFESRTVLESELEDDLCTEDCSSMDDSSFLPSFNKKPSPFATSKTMFEINETGKSDEWKEEVMPGSRDEVHQFEEATKDRASNMLKCFMPVLKLHLPSQHFYSTLYHRFGQDLSLWQSALVKRCNCSVPATAPSSLYPLTSVTSIYPLTDPLTDPMTQTIRPHHIHNEAPSFKPLHREESSGEEDEDDPRMCTIKPKQSRSSKSTVPTTILSVVIGRAQLSLCTELPCPAEVVKSEEKNEKLVDVDSPKRKSSQSDSIGGIAVFDVTQFTLSSITAHNGDPTMDYLCLQIDKFSIGHYSNYNMDQFSTYSCVNDCPDAKKLLHAHLLPVITPAPGNMLVSGDCDSHKRDPMLSIAMEIISDPTQNTKTNICAIAVRNGLLEYFVTPSELNCFSQLIQFLDIDNEEIPGYVPQPVVTALHVHFIDSTAVYRPKYLPWQIAFGVSAGHFSTTLASTATTSMMRLIIDESYIFLTNKPEKNLDLKQDYVCVVEIGLLEIHIKMQTGHIPESLNIPEISLEFSNNLIEFRTCVDTCAGLRDLMQYIASYGDLRDFVLVKAKSFDSSKDETESVDGFSTPLASLTSNASIPLPSGANQMDLMDDAMEELAIENTGGSKRTDKVYKPSRDKRKSPGSKRKTSYKKLSTEAKMKLSNPNLKSIKVPVNFSDSDDDSLGAINKKITGKHKFPLSPARSSMSSNVTSEESEDDFLILDLPTSSKMRTLSEYLMAIPGQSTKLNVRQSVFVAKPPNSVSAECITPMAKGAKPVIQSYLSDDETLKIEPNHFAPSNSFTDQLHRPENFPVPVTMYTLKDMNVIWHLYGGSDFQKSSTPSPVSSSSDNSSSPAMKHREFHPRQDVPSADSPTSLSKPHINPRTSPHSSRSHLNNNNSRYKRPSNISDSTHYKKKTHKGKMLNWKVAGGPDRNHDVVMEIHINKLRMQHEVYPENKEQSTRFVLLVREIELVDRLAASQLNKFLSQYVSNTMPKQTHANMVSFKMLSIRTELEEYPEREEVIIHASALPLRLYVDQDALEFLVNFMADLSSTKSAEIPPPSPEMFEQPSSLSSTDQTDGAATTPDPIIEPPYFKEFLFYPSVVIKIDYEAKRFDMEKGVIPGILVGLSHIDSAEIELKSLKFCGVLGWDRLVSEIVNEWTGDVRSQLPKILGGVGPMHYLMQFAQGVVDFVWLPVQQYQQDGRVVRGIQRGATSLATSTGMATVELTTRLVQTIEFIAATTYDFVAPVDRNSNSSLVLQRRRNPRRPQDFRSGVSTAWKTLTTGINDTAGDIYHTVTREHDDGVARTLGEVLRQVPGVVVRPILIASEATRHMLGGVRNQLMPDARKDELAKYRDDT